jgi:hypothetical protein
MLKINRVGRNPWRANWPGRVVDRRVSVVSHQDRVRAHRDRPQVVPEGSTDLVFIGQYAEVPDDVVFTVEYSVRTLSRLRLRAHSGEFNH